MEKSGIDFVEEKDIGILGRLLVGRSVSNVQSLMDSISIMANALGSYFVRSWQEHYHIQLSRHSQIRLCNPAASQSRQGEVSETLS